MSEVDIKMSEVVFCLFVGKFEAQHYGHGGMEAFELAIPPEKTIEGIITYLVEKGMHESSDIYRLVIRSRYGSDIHRAFTFTSIWNFFYSLFGVSLKDSYRYEIQGNDFVNVKDSGFSAWVQK